MYLYNILNKKLYNIMYPIITMYNENVNIKLTAIMEGKYS